MSPDQAEREARLMAEALSSRAEQSPARGLQLQLSQQAHREAHEQMRARLVRDLGHGRPRPPIRGDHGSSAILLVFGVAAVALVVVFVARLAAVASAAFPTS